MKQLTDIELKKASILDLTDDLELMRAALDSEGFEISDMEGWVEDARMISLFSFAEYTGDKRLLNRLEKLFKIEMELAFNE